MEFLSSLIILSDSCLLKTKPVYSKEYNLFFIIFTLSYFSPSSAIIVSFKYSTFVPLFITVIISEDEFGSSLSNVSF